MKRNLKIIKMAIALLAVGSLLALSLGNPSSVQAQTTVLYAAPAAQGSGSCSSWTNACTLQTALTTAATDSEIWVMKGTHTPGSNRTDTFQLKNGVALYGGFAGTETSRDERNWVTNVTTLSGDIGVQNEKTDNSYHVVTGSGTDGTAVLDGFTIAYGYADGTDPQNKGGGIYNYQGSPTLTNVAIYGNTADYGGGMYNQNSSPTLTKVNFTSNSGFLTISNHDLGAGIYNDQSNPKLVDVNFYVNYAQNGGGMYNAKSSPTLVNISFSRNHVDYYGGGMYNDNYSSPTLTNVSFGYNRAYTNGGAMYNNNNSNPIVKNAIMWDDTYNESKEICNDVDSTPQIYYSDIQGCGGSGSSWVSTCGTDGGGNINAYPGFVDPSNGNLRLNIASQAIDAGNNADVPSEITTDLDGNPRVVHGTVDMGAYEFQQSNYIYRVIPDGASSGNCGYDWGHGCDLQYALVTKSLSGDELWVETGTYTTTTTTDRTVSFVLKDGVPLYGGFAGTETSREQRDWETNITTLSGDIGAAGDISDNSYHVVTSSGVDSSVVLDGFTISGGNANGSSPDNSGGGLYNDQGSLTLANITFSSNAATYGGGMYNASYNETMTNITFSSNAATHGGGMYNDNSSPTLENGTFSGNQASLGGGMFNYDNSRPVLTNMSFTGNSATSYGGGMYNEQSSPTLTNMSFTGNSATSYGGGMYNEQSSPTLDNGTFSSNDATNGGGMYNKQSSPVLTNLTFNGNSATDYGGGMYNEKSSPALENGTFSGNHALLGGGVFNFDDSSPMLTNITFSGNDANMGGGMYNLTNSSPTLTNVTFSGNSTITKGGGMYNHNQSNPVVKNAILWGNSGDYGAIYNDNSTPTISTSDIQGCMPGGVWSSACGTDSGGNLDADPLLGALGDYGGTMQTLPLLPGSAAIDTGDDTSCPATDQRGISRLQGAHCDMGAYESRGFTLTKTSGDMQGALVNTAFAEPLVIGVSSDYSEPVDGGEVTFTAPTSGASTNPLINEATISAGAAFQSLTANGESGLYNVTANAAGAAPQVEFTLLNSSDGHYYAAPTAQGSEDCLSWGNACTLRSAFLYTYHDNEIWVEAGLHYPGSARTDTFTLKTGVAVYGGFAGTETSRDDRDWEANVTTLSGDIGTTGDNSDNSYQVVTGSGTDNTAVLDGFTITKGNANGSDPYLKGGGMYNVSGSPTLANLNFDQNYGESSGGGMYNYQSSSPTLTNVTFSGNRSTDGGGMYNGDNSSPALMDVTFSSNDADRGGGMYNFQGSNPTLTNVIFSGNSATYNGGGVFSFLSSLTLMHVTFSGNESVKLNGGGMYNASGTTPITTTFSDVTFSGNSAGTDGGGMFDTGQSQGVLEDITFSGNSAGASGGGMHIRSNNNKLKLMNVSFTDNSATDGGGMTIFNYATPTLTNVTFSGNTAIEEGGGMYIYDHANPILTDITFSDNTADISGGGITIFNYATPTLTDVTFSGNTAIEEGGGMYCIQNSNPTLTNVSFSNNQAYDNGGGVYSEQCSPTLTDVSFIQNAATSGGGMSNNASNPTLENIAFSSNHAYFGGGVYNTAASSPVLTNVSFSGNNATYCGGMYNIASSNPTLTNVSFSGNDANYYGGGICNRSTSNPVIKNTILWGNSAPTGAEIYNINSNPTISASDVQDCGGSGSGWVSACGTDSGDNIDADPYFGVLGDYGGFSQTLPLLPGSAAIDAGDSTSCPTTDQRGVTRPQGAHCDIGAYESRGFTLTKTSGDGQIALVNTAFAKPLVVDVSSTNSEPVDGGVVTFTAPASGASAIPQMNTVTILGGTVSQSLSANGESGSYNVAVDTIGAAALIEFTLHNNPIGLSYAAPTARGSGDCSSWGNACTLQTALAYSSNGHEIWVEAGLHYPGTTRNATFALKNGVKVYGGFAGTEMSREQRDWVTHVTILSGEIGDLDDNSDNVYHVVTGSGLDSSAMLDGFTISGGNANGASPDDRGGGMYNDQSSLTLTNLTFRGNSAIAGGGMYNVKSNPVLTNLVFSGNSAVYFGGGLINYQGSPVLTNLTLSGNSAELGGGMYNNASSPLVNNAILWGDSARYSAEIYNIGSSNPTISTSDVQGCGGSSSWNTACGTDGGGNLDADPLFVDAAKGNLHLQTASPAIDTGDNAAVPVGVTTDLDGNLRFIDGDGDRIAVVDIGAYEWQLYKYKFYLFPIFK